MTSKELAERVGVSQNTISNFAGGKNIPKPELLVNLAKKLNVQVPDLFYSTSSG